MKYTDEERREINRLAKEIIVKFVVNDRSGRLLYLFVCQLSGLSKLSGFRGDDEYKFSVVKENEYKKFKEFLSKKDDDLIWLKDIKI